MKINDRRTDEQKKTHLIGIVVSDKVLSAWCPYGKSWACWALPYDGSLSESKLIAWLESQRYTRIRKVNLETYRPRGKGHISIYVMTKDHPSQ